MPVASLNTAVICEKPLRDSERVLSSPGAAGQGRLDREGDLLFDLDRRQRRRGGIDLDLLVGDVGDGVDRQPRQCDAAEEHQDRRQRDDDPAALDLQTDDALNPGCAPPRPSRARP